jgi:PGF-CTERM protein
LVLTRAVWDVNRSLSLLVGALGLLVLLVVAAVAVPGALADREESIRPAYLDYRDSAVQAGAVTGETVTLQFETRLGHAGGPARNVTVEVRAVDAASGMQVATATTDLGTVTGEREVSALTNLTVPRQGAYDLRTVVYVDGQRRVGGSQTVSGVGTLVPEYARTDLAFRSFPAPTTSIPPVVYTVQDVSDGQATLDVTPFLTNTGDEPESGLELVVLARQADSNIVADRAVVPVGEIAPGRTAEPSLTVTVPDDYNYYLDAMLRRDGVVVATTSVPASLDPTEDVPENMTRRDVDLETGDFEQDDGSGGGPPDEPAMTEGSQGPGFGVAAALLAILTGTALYARRSR